MLAQRKQIDLLKSRDEMNEKMVELVKPNGMRTLMFG